MSSRTFRGIFCALLLILITGGCSSNSADRENSSVSWNEFKSSLVPAAEFVGNPLNNLEICDRVSSAVDSQSEAFALYSSGAISDSQIADVGTWLADVAAQSAKRANQSFSPKLMGLSVAYRGLANSLRDNNPSQGQNWIEEVQAASQEFNAYCESLRVENVESETDLTDDRTSECLGSESLIESDELSDRYWSAWCMSSIYPSFVGAGLVLSEGSTWRSFAESIGMNLCADLTKRLDNGESIDSAREAEGNELAAALVDGSSDETRIVAASGAAIGSVGIALKFLCPELERVPINVDSDEESDESSDRVAAAPGEISTSAYRLGDWCPTQMAREFVDLRVFPKSRIVENAQEFLSDFGSNESVMSLAVVIDREVSEDYVYVPGKFHEGEIQVTVVTICGVSGSQNSVSPSFGVGRISYIYSYGGDAEISGDPQVGDLVFYTADCGGACIYGFHLFGKPSNVEAVKSAVNKMCTRFGGCGGVQP